MGHYYAGKTDTTPKTACAFEQNFPNIKVVFAHWGGGLLFYEMMPEIRAQNKNVYYDIAATPLLYDNNIYVAAKSMKVLGANFIWKRLPSAACVKRYLEDISNSGISKVMMKSLSSKW